MDLRQRVELAASYAGILSQRELAAKIGVTQPSIHALLAERFPMQDVLERIAMATRVSARWLRLGPEADAPAWAHDIYRMEQAIEALELAAARAATTAERRVVEERIAQRRRRLEDRLGIPLRRIAGSGTSSRLSAAAVTELARLRRRIADQVATIRELTRQLATQEAPRRQPRPAPASRPAARVRRLRPVEERYRPRG